jgi:hypothetical protein
MFSSKCSISVSVLCDSVVAQVSRFLRLPPLEVYVWVKCISNLWCCVIPVHELTKCATEVHNRCSGLTTGPNGSRPVTRDDVAYLCDTRLHPAAVPIHIFGPCSSFPSQIAVSPRRAATSNHMGMAVPQSSSSLTNRHRVNPEIPLITCPVCGRFKVSELVVQQWEWEQGAGVLQVPWWEGTD